MDRWSRLRSLVIRGSLAIVLVIGTTTGAMEQAAAQGTGAEAGKTPPGGGTPPPSGSSARVTGIERVNRHEFRRMEQCTETAPCIALGDRLKVTVADPKELKLTDDQRKQFRLVVDGRTIPGLNLEAALAPGGKVLTFDLEYVGDSKTAWRKLLGPASAWSREATVTVLDGANLLESGKKVRLLIMSKAWFIVWAVLTALILVGFGLVAARSDLLRDAGPQPGAAPDPLKILRKPFSLGRCQMAVWLFVVLVSFLFIGLVTGSYAIVSSQAIALMGVSAATAVGARTIDRVKRDAEEDQRRTLDVERTNLRVKHEGLVQDIAAIITKLATNPPAQEAAVLTLTQSEKQIERDRTRARLQQIEEALAKLGDGPRPAVSEGLVRDILSDESGVTLHRFQMVTWTLVLALVFWSQVYRELAMPEFSAELLALLGISGGTYLGFKFPERPA